ncbi:MAG: signal recognition particle receptor subunit alpha [archaeon]
MSFGDKLQDAISKIKNSLHVDKDLVKEVIKDIQRALISSDVNIQLVLKISKEIEEEAFAEISSQITRKEHLIRICYEILLRYIGGDTKAILPENPESILLCGLFGSGKTTTVGKLAKFYKKRGLKVGVICADTYRPAAYEQLEQLSKLSNVLFYGNLKEKNASKVVKNGLEYLKKENANLIIVDSAGRSALDSELISELKEINNVFNAKFKFLVLSADIGQAAKDQAENFNLAVEVNGVIITKLDGSSKGGGALTACYITKSPIYFIGTGEKVDDIEIFDANRYLSRILGFGDLQSLIEKINEISLEESSENLKDLNADDILKGNFTFALFKQQMEAAKKLGPLTKVMGFLGLGSKIPNDAANLGQKKMDKFRAILNSFTRQELNSDTSFITKSRIKRISKGSGTSEEDVKELISSVKKMKKMFKNIDPNKMGSLMKNMKGSGIDPDNPEALGKVDFNQLKNLGKKVKYR